VFKQFSNRTKKVIILCLALYIISLFLTAFTYNDSNADSKLHITKGFETLIMGSTAVLGGGVFEWIVWLANPFFFFSIILLNEGKKIFAFFSSLTAILLGILFSQIQDILVSESGQTEEIQSRGAGYYIWLSVFVIWFVYLVIGRNNHLKNNS
jgi:hypothetical protein